MLCQQRIKLSFSLSKTAWIWLVLSVQAVRLPKKGLGSLWTAGGRNLAGTWCVPMVSCATLPCFLPGLVASEEEDAE